MVRWCVVPSRVNCGCTTFALRPRSRVGRSFVAAQVTDSDLDGNEFVKTNAWVEGEMVTTAIKRNPPSKPPFITRRWIEW